MAISGTHQQMIDEVMDSFDFGKVAAVMEFLGWEWGCEDNRTSVPDERTIRKEARRVMSRVIEDNQGDGESCIVCGGLVAMFRGAPNGYLRLSLEIEDYEVNAREL